MPPGLCAELLDRLWLGYSGAGEEAPLSVGSSEAGKESVAGVMQ